MEPIAAVAAAAGVPLIEDAAQAHGADVHQGRRHRGPRRRATAIAGCFSFYPGKNLGAFGDAGAITTNDDDLAEAMRLLRDHGSVKKYEHGIVGFADRSTRCRRPSWR